MTSSAAGAGRTHGRLEGRRALITDGASRLGREVSLAFAKEGADLAIGYSSDDPDATEVTGALARAAGAHVVLLPGDLRDEGVCRDVVDRAADRLGGLDTLVMIERVARSNLSTLRWLSRATLAHFRAGSAIIATSPLAPSAIMTPAFLQRMRRHGVRMRGIAPGLAASHPGRVTDLYVELAAR
ncbi:MAG TPA: SDR family NAD(P)-dependent oxidoreductase [Pseudolysinimonas sp.]